jgi:histidinol dehydrogenase
MRTRHFEWEGAAGTAKAIRRWGASSEPEGIPQAVAEIRQEVELERDDALRRLTARFDAVEQMPETLHVDPADAKAALKTIESDLREAMEVAASNICAVSEAQISDDPQVIQLPQGQVVTVREVPVASAGIYAPGGRAAYPSSVLMCALPARVAGVKQISLATPPGVDGCIPAPVLAAAALCEIEEIYAIGGAQAVFALAYGTPTVTPVDVIAGPGNFWVQEAKRLVTGVVGVDSYAGPSELMLVADRDTDPEWAALDLCGQAEHGSESPLVVVAVEGNVLDAIATATKRLAAERPGVADAPLALAQVPNPNDAIDLANAFAPEHLELVDASAARQAERITTAGCVFVGRYGATAFGDYAAGSNHVLPTNEAGRFSGPLGPDVFRRKIATVEVSAEAAAKLAPHVDTIAKAEGFPVHGESAMIRVEEN